LFTLLVFVVGLPALTFLWVWRDPHRRRAAADVAAVTERKWRSARREPIVAPFLLDSGYTPKAWFWRHLDMAVVLGLTVVAALLPLPATMDQLAVKLALTFALLGVLLVSLVALPNPYEQPWRWYLRVGLVAHLRDPVKFEGIGPLVAQIQRDSHRAVQIVGPMLHQPAGPHADVTPAPAHAIAAGVLA
jgi:hypothetical protein